MDYKRHKKSIEVRGRLYKDMIRIKTMQSRQIKKKSFKKYCNKTVYLIKINKNDITTNLLKETKTSKLYCKEFTILCILKRAVELILPLHCL